jgi:hypothetical protein
MAGLVRDMHRLNLPRRASTTFWIQCGWNQRRCLDTVLAKSFALARKIYSLGIARKRAHVRRGNTTSVEIVAGIRLSGDPSFREIFEP